MIYSHNLHQAHRAAIAASALSSCALNSAGMASVTGGQSRLRCIPTRLRHLAVDLGRSSIGPMADKAIISALVKSEITGRSTVSPPDSFGETTHGGSFAVLRNIINARSAHKHIREAT